MGFTAIEMLEAKETLENKRMNLRYYLSQMESNQNETISLTKDEIEELSNCLGIAVSILQRCLHKDIL